MHSHRLVSPLAAAASVAPWVIATIVFGQDAAKPTDQPAAEPPPDPAASATASPAPAAPAPAAPAPAEPTPSPLSLQLNLDFTNIYFYHGILQQDQDLIIQPVARLTFNVYKQDDFKVDAILATWNSFGKNGGTQTSDLTKWWYECDLIAGVALTKGPFSLTTTYTFLTSPSDAYQTVQELDFTLAWDDSELLGKFALHPYALLGLETGNAGADGPDLHSGIYLELGVAPGFTLDLGQTPVAVSFPVSVGLSMSNYYENAAGEEDFFGFAQVGAKAAIPLPFGDRVGKWTLNMGVAGIFLGDNTAALNRGRDASFIATMGLQVNF